MKKIFLITLLILSMNIAGFSAIYSGKGLKLHGDSASSMGKGGTGISSYGVDLFHLNPASIANYERIGLGIQYGNLLGGFINPDVSVAIPTSYGIFGTSVRYFNSSNSPDFQTGYDVAIGGAKDFTKEIAIGISLNMFYGSGNGSNYYFGGTVGSIYKFDGQRMKKGFGFFTPQVGFAFNFGLPIGDTMTNSNFNSITLGYNFMFYNHKKFNLSFNNDISAVTGPGDKASVKAGVESVILRKYVVRTGAAFPHSYGYGDYTFGLGYKFEAKKFKGSVDYGLSYSSESKLTHFIGITGEYGDLDRKPPVTKIKSDKLYLSPNHDGIQDYVIFDLNVEDQSRIKGWKLQVLDENKKIVKEFKTSDRDTIDGLTIKGFFKRLFQKKTSLNVPEKIMWDGTNKKGKVVSDGKYGYAFNAWDGRDNISVAKRGSVFIDNTPPNVKLSVKENLFSPNGDNKKDEFIITQNIVSEPADNWKACLKDSNGKIVKNFSWTGTVPNQIIWDGKDEAGKKAPEGLYFYHISTTDKAGNSTKGEIKEIILTRKYEIADIKLSAEYFSFQKDKVINLFPILSKIKGLTNWEINIENSEGESVHKISGKSELPKVIKWNCKTDKDEKFEDGIYFLSFNSKFVSGNTPKSFKKKLIIDSSSPEVEISHTPDLFSPDNDDENDILTIKSKAKEEFEIDNWKINIYTSAGSLFKSFNGKGDVPKEIKWDGLSETKDIVESAADYFIQLTATDKAGNIGKTKKSKLQVDILVIVTERGLKMRISNIEFGFNRHNLKRNGKKILNRVKELLDKYERYDVIIEGHTDDIGKEEYNLKLSERRGESVRNYLIKKGIEKTRLQFFGMGETVPLYENKNNENRRRNRRVEFLLIKKEQ